MSEYQGNIIIKNPATPTGPSALGSAPGMWRLNDVAYWIKQGVWPDANILPDTYFKYVSLLLSTTSLGNASNNLFVDSSGAFIPLSRFGNTTQGSYTPYSTNWSNYFDGSGDYLTAPSNVAFALGTGDFTIEAWVYTSDTSFMLFSSQTGGGVGFGYNIDNSSQGLWLGRVGQGPDATSGVQLTYNQWNHIAVTRQSGSVKFFVNGVQSGSTQTVTVNYGTSAQGFFVGRDLTLGAFDFGGYASNARLVKGTAVYTSNFTVPTSPLTAISGTSLLTCQSNRFIDNSSNAFAITVNGNTSVNDFGPFSPTYPGAAYNQNDITNWSGYFDGSGDSLSGPSWSAAGNFGTSDFTVEGWFYATGAPQSNNVIWSCNIYPNTTGLILRYVGGGSTDLDVRCGNSGVVAASGGWSFNEWHHVAVVRSSGTLTLYIDGVSRGSASFTNNCTDGLQYIGRPSDTSNFAYQGYMSNFRIVKGTAVYTSAFTPPTTNLTAISGTSLLTLQNAAFTDNSANSYIITPNGEVTVTGNSPFNTVGYWSNYLDGSGDYLQAPNNAAFAFGTGDFTVEMWAYFLDTGGVNKPIFDTGVTTNTGRLLIRQGDNGSTANVVNAFLSGTTAASPSFSFNQWTHVAVVRSSGTLKVYINGVGGTGVSATANLTENAGIIGRFYDLASFFFGYLSNMRVVKGTAVYTSNFTPPTAPLTAISGTSLLTCQNGRFIDNSTNAFAITVNGNPSVQSFDPFYTATIASNGGSLYFDGTGDYLNAGSPSDWTFLHNGAVNWTVEYWAYNNNNTTRQDSFSTNTNSTGGAYGITFYQFSSTAQIGVQIVNGIDGNNFNCITTNSPLLANCWNHVAVTFVTATKTLNIYVNGVLCATTTNAGYAFGSVAPNYTLQVGRWIGSVSGVGGYWNGYISNARITRGAVLYTGTFTPPTTPLTPSANTVLLLNGMNAGIYDAATINDMETAGNAQVRYPSPFAPATYYAGSFDGSGDYISVPSNAAFALGSGNFTMEMWVFSGANGTSTRLGGNGTGGSWAANRWVIATSTPSNPNKFTFALNNASPVDLLVSTSTFNNSQWMHVAIARSGNSWALWVNGTREAYVASNSAAVDGGTSEVLNIGRSNLSGDADWAGIVSNFRLVKGSAVYDPTSTSISVPTTPLTAVSGTSLLTCQNKTFIDNSSNAFTITAAGNATAGAIGPFAAAGVTSMYFDGSGDYLVAANNPTLNLGSGDFTIELWLNVPSVSSQQGIIVKRNTETIADGTWGLRINAGGNLYFEDITNSSGIVTFGPLPTNTWNHVAVTRSGSTVRGFLNGSLISSGTSTRDFTNSFVLNIGFWGTASGVIQNYLNGYIDDLRITRGIARYTANFTPPTQAFPVY